LYAHNEPPPLGSKNASSNQQVLVFDGDTEIDPDEYDKKRESDESLLLIKFVSERFSLRARRQPAVLVAGKIAEQLSVPVSLLKETRDVVDVDLKDLYFEDFFQRLPPSIKLKYRRYLHSSQTQFVEIIIDGTAKGN
jgi:hypothetical protein